MLLVNLEACIPMEHRCLGIDALLQVHQPYSQYNPVKPDPHNLTGACSFVWMKEHMNIWDESHDE